MADTGAGGGAKGGGAPGGSTPGTTGGGTTGGGSASKGSGNGGGGFFKGKLPDQLPDPPEGFSWAQLASVAAVLLTGAYVFRLAREGKLYGKYVSKETKDKGDKEKEKKDKKDSDRLETKFLSKEPTDKDKKDLKDKGKSEVAAVGKAAEEKVVESRETMKDTFEQVVNPKNEDESRMKQIVLLTFGGVGATAAIAGASYAAYLAYSKMGGDTQGKPAKRPVTKAAEPAAAPPPR